MSTRLLGTGKRIAAYRRQGSYMIMVINMVAEGWQTTSQHNATAVAASTKTRAPYMQWEVITVEHQENTP